MRHSWIESSKVYDCKEELPRDLSMTDRVELVEGSEDWAHLGEARAFGLDDDESGKHGQRDT